MTIGSDLPKIEPTDLTQRMSRTDLQKIPKVDLHRHLEGALRLSTIRECAKEQGLDFNSSGVDLKQQFQINQPVKDLATFLEIFKKLHQVLGTKAVLERVAYEAVADAYTNEGIRILELRYSPTFVQGDRRNLSFDDIHQAFVRGIQRAEAEFPIAVGLILIVQRILPVPVAEQVCDFAIANKATVIGLDLADSEVGFDCRPFASVFQKARAAGLRITVHAGEADVPQAPQSVLDAIELLGAERIGHGLQIIKDPRAVKLVVERKVTLELCPYSNWLCNAVPSTQSHPFVRLMQAGVLVTINSDDPGFMTSDLITDYEILANQHGINLKQFTECNETARRVSFIADDKKRRVWPVSEPSRM